MTVTRVLSECADAAVAAAVRFLFRKATEQGVWQPPDATAPEQASGYFVLAMGKLGAFELNYSSDIDLVVFYDGCNDWANFVQLLGAGRNVDYAWAIGSPCSSVPVRKKTSSPRCLMWRARMSAAMVE